jgi:hypothetical protein
MALANLTDVMNRDTTSAKPSLSIGQHNRIGNVADHHQPRKATSNLYEGLIVGPLAWENYQRNWDGGHGLELRPSILSHKANTMVPTSNDTDKPWRALAKMQSQQMK